MDLLSLTLMFRCKYEVDCWHNLCVAVMLYLLLVDVYCGLRSIMHEYFSVAIFYWTRRDLHNLSQKGCDSFLLCCLCHASASGGT